MFCPECHAEYREGFSECAQCGVDLVEHPEPEEDSVEGKGPDPAARLVPVLRTDDIGLAAVAGSLLEAAGIDYTTSGDYLRGSLIPVGGSHRDSGRIALLVREEDHPEARELLFSLLSARPRPDL